MIVRTCLLLLTGNVLTAAFSPTSTRSTLNQKQSLLKLNQASGEEKQFEHATAILAMPYTSIDRIANEVILNKVLPRTNKLSVVLRCQGACPSLATLRSYVGEVYSQLWDCVANDRQVFEIPDVVVYPQNLPNTAPEAWIDIQPDLQAVCSHDSLIGWVSEQATGRGTKFQSTQGKGGLKAHVKALNAERKSRGLQSVVALNAEEHWPNLNNCESVVFVDDEPGDLHKSTLWKAANKHIYMNGQVEGDDDDDEPSSNIILGGARLPFNQKMLYESVCVGGTFDGLHFGHRKLLTLAVSSVNPLSGSLLVGVTVDEMLVKKKYAEFMPSFEERCRGVEDFLQRLAPGMMNRVQIVPIEDKFGPPGKADKHFDALVLSHETLQTGYELNQHRVENLQLEPLKLLCTRRTEAHGMSSTTLRKLRAQEQQQRVLEK